MKAKLHWPLLASTVLLLATSSAVLADTTADPLLAGDPQSGYRVGDGSDAPPPADSTAASNEQAATKGPVRLSRISYVTGNVSWRPSETESWSSASVNLPLRQGAQLWVTNGGRAEIQFDDGAMLRLGSGAIVTLTTLYSDADGEFTEIQLQEGLGTLELKHAHSIYQIDTPTVSIKSDGPSNVRVGVDTGSEIAVHQGKATIHGTSGTTVLQAGSYLDLADANAPFEVGAIPSLDNWDRWNDDRDRLLADADSQQNLPPNIALVAGNLDTYGSWRSDPVYGQVWCPRAQPDGWRPYHDGSWTWVEPFGWTWVSSEPWGWAPYHYGTWVYQPYGWAWCPGPAHQYWCPAVVHFNEYNGSVAWCPLAPREVHYPAVLSIGFGHGDWSAFFSIGGAACYYPAGPTYCEPRRFNTFVVNTERFGHFTPNIVDVVNGRGPGRPVYAGAFVPFNARNSASVTITTTVSFGGRPQYVTPGRGSTEFFATRTVIPAPAGRGGAFSGPMGIRPTAISYTPTRTILTNVHPATAILQRPVYRAPLPARVESFAPPAEHVRVLPATPRAGTPDRPVTINRGPGQGSPADRSHQAAINARQDFGGFNNGTRTNNGGTNNNAPRTFGDGTPNTNNRTFGGGTTNAPGTPRTNGGFNQAPGRTAPTSTFGGAPQPAGRGYHFTEGTGSRPQSTRPTTRPAGNTTRGNGNDDKKDKDKKSGN